MFKLINIELKKVFKHKSIYIIFFIIFLFCMLNNVLYKIDYDSEGNYKYESKTDLTKYISKLEKRNNEYDLSKESDKYLYITNRSKIEVAKIQKKYDVNDWRYLKASDYLYDYIYNINYYKYINTNDVLLEDSISKYKFRLEKFQSNDWKYFVELEKDEIKKNIKEYEELIDSTNNVEEKNKLKNEKLKLSNELVIINYRIEESISYNNTYLNDALMEYLENLNDLNGYKNINSDMSHSQKLEYNSLIEDLNTNKYIIENKVNVHKQNTLNYQLRTIVDDYELFVIIVILMVSSILIGEEFSRGTIKLLLVKPYSRIKILLAKYITCLLVVFLTISFLVMLQLVIGSILFGIDSIDLGMIIYDFNSEKIMKMNIFLYMIIRILAKMPMLIIILNLSFLFGIVLNNIIGPFSIVMIIYTFSEVINNMIITYNLKFMKYFITLNWNFQDYLFGGISTYKYLDLKKSMLIFIIYDIILLGIMFISFKRKNVKNI